MKAPFRLGAIGLCCLLLATGCGRASASESRSILMAAPPQSTSTGAGAASNAEPEPPPEDIAIPLSTAARSIASGYAGSPNGCYSLVNYEDGSADIAYIDYAALEMVILEGVPAEAAKKKGRLAGVHGAATPVWAGEHLFIFRQRGSDALVEAYGEGMYAGVTRYNADGTGPMAHTFGANYSFALSSAALWDGQNLYFIAEDHSGDVCQTVLVQLDTQTMEPTELHRFEAGFDYSIEGFWEKGPLICAAGTLPPTSDPSFNEVWSTRAYSLFKLGMRSGIREEVMGWGQGLAWTVHNDDFYFYQADEDAVYAQNTNSGEKRVIANGLAPQDYIVVQLQPVRDGLVRLQFSTNQGRTIYNYTIHPATGAVNQPPVDNLGENVSVLAEADEFFVVRNGDKWVRRELVNPSYDPAADPNGDYNDKFVSVSEYALIQKADYWAGNARFTAIADMVYDKK